jgi:signal transduction histidine kinase/class 3 adenylate cyclase
MIEGKPMEKSSTRKLCAILGADVKGYSLLMGKDEAATVQILRSHREVVASLIRQCRGRVVDAPGDNILAEFGSVVDAVECAISIQREIKARNAELPEERRMEFRIGVNLGDVIEEDGRIYGDGVNITARIESLAESGGICISETAYDHVEKKLPLEYEYLGEQEVKNIEKPIRVYRIITERKPLGEIEDKTKEKLQQELEELGRKRGELEAKKAETLAREKVLREALDYIDLAGRIVDTIGEPMVVLDKDLRVVWAIPSFYQTFKVTPEETEGQFLYDLGNHQWDIPRLREMLEKIIPQDASFDDFEIEHDFPDIGHKAMRLIAKRIKQREGKSHLILLAIEDITTRKQAQQTLMRAHAELEERVKDRTAELLQKTQELSRSNAELEYFAHVASHDLKEPLIVVSGFLNLLSRRYADKLDDKAKDFISKALDASIRMQKLIDDLLIFSRASAGGKEFKPTDCNLVLDQVLNDLQPAIAESRAHIIRDPLPAVMADSVQLGRVFQNLIGNALKYRADRPLQVHIGSERLDNELRIFVKDNGIGIETKNLKQIFEMFERLDSGKNHPGTGMGLAICKKIVEHHGGRIWAESEPGKGSTFFFTIQTTDMNL